MPNKKYRTVLYSTNIKLIENFKKAVLPEGIEVFNYQDLQSIDSLFKVDPHFSMVFFDYSDNKDMINEKIKTIKQQQIFKTIPIILLLPLENIVEQFSVLEVGADDFITMPYQTLDLQLRIRILLNLTRFKRNLLEAEKKLQSVKTFKQITVTLSHYINNAITPLMLMMPENKERIKNEEMEHFIETTGKTMEFIKKVIDTLREMASSGNMQTMKEGIYKNTLIDIQEKLKTLK